MPKVNHVRAAKDYPDIGVKKGEQYYWWKFNFGPKVRSKTPPRASQLTRSEFLGAMCDIEDEIGALSADDGLESVVSEIAGRVRELGEEQESKKENMPDSLQESDTGQALQNRSDRCGEIADELEAITFDVSDKEEAQTEEEFWQEKLDEVQAVDLTTD